MILLRSAFAEVEAFLQFAPKCCGLSHSRDSDSYPKVVPLKALLDILLMWLVYSLKGSLNRDPPKPLKVEPIVPSPRKGFILVLRCPDRIPPKHQGAGCRR